MDYIDFITLLSVFINGNVKENEVFLIAICFFKLFNSHSVDTESSVTVVIRECHELCGFIDFISSRKGFVCSCATAHLLQVYFCL